MGEKYIHNTILINAGRERVWDLLTKPEFTRQYMFGSETVSDWKAGSSLQWKGTYEGKEMVFVKGEIIEISRPQRLVYTVFDPNNPQMADVPENYLTVEYELKDENGATRLDVRQGDYSKVAEGERRYNESYNNGEGWNPILVQIKKLAELEAADKK